MLQRGVTTDDIATLCAVDPKTVDRWINPGRVPRRRHRWETAKRLGVEESYLWPPSLADTQTVRRGATESELIEIYSDRASVARETWLRLMTEAESNIDVLVFSGTFFAQTNPRVATMLAERAAAGVQVRLCFGDPTSAAVELRDQEEGIRGTLASKIRASLTYYEPLLGIERCEVRLHATTLYASLFRYDDDLLVNPHIYGMPASANPLLHLRRLDSHGWFDRYADSFDAVWESATPWTGAEDVA